MSAISRVELLSAFERVRRAKRGDRFAPHKPLLLLLALARVQRAEPRRVSFIELEPKLRELLDEFGPSGSAARCYMPFWHLGTDHDGALWRVDGPPALVNRPAGATPTLGELRDAKVLGGFSEEVHAALTADPALIVDVARSVLRAYFPSTIRDDIAAAAGLDVDAPGDDVEEPSRRQRDPAFRDRVLTAYERRCCVCGFDLRLRNATAGLEAAHIKWKQAGGPDVVPNGLALCSLHHKLFDLGVFGIEPAERRVVFSEHAIDGARGLDGELRYHGRPMHPPQRADYAPDPRFLAWNYQTIFKRPERSIAAPTSPPRRP